MTKISFKVAYLIIIAGLFIIISIVAFNYQSLNSSFYTVVYLLVIYIFLFGFAAGHNFALPIKSLLQKADDLSKGDLKSRFYLKNKDELGELAKKLNKIAEDLEQSSVKNEASKESAGIKSKTRILILEEVINALDKKIKNRTLEFQKIAEDSEKLKKQLKLKNMEAVELKNQITRLEKKLNRSKTGKVLKK